MYLDDNCLEYEEQIKEELTPVDQEEIYNDYLDEVHETCSLCSQYGASRILLEVDPIAYRCGLNDFLDMQENYYYIDDELYEKEEVDDLTEKLMDKDQ